MYAFLVSAAVNSFNNAEYIASLGNATIDDAVAQQLAPVRERIRHLKEQVQRTVTQQAETEKHLREQYEEIQRKEQQLRTTLAEQARIERQLAEQLEAASRALALAKQQLLQSATGRSSTSSSTTSISSCCK